MNDMTYRQWLIGQALQGTAEMLAPLVGEPQAEIRAMEIVHAARLIAQVVMETELAKSAQ